MKLTLVALFCSLSLPLVAHSAVDCSDNNLQKIDGIIARTLSKSHLRTVSFTLRQCNLNEKQTRETREYALDLLLAAGERSHTIDVILGNLP